MSDRINKLKEFLKSTPNDCFLNHALALEYIKLGEELEARKVFEHNMTFDQNYVATYYHLAKLLERLGEEDEAVAIYEKGMEVAKAQNDNHSYSELRSAHEELTF